MNKLLDEFKTMTIAAHCLHTGQSVEKTSFDDVQECTYGFCRERYRLFGEAVSFVTKIDTPHIEDFMEALPLEAAHQIKRWGNEHDSGKDPEDWFWLVGYLAGKALRSAINGDIAKAKHHTISTAAVMLNWHRRLSGSETSFQPGSDKVSESNKVSESSGKET